MAGDVGAQGAFQIQAESYFGQMGIVQPQGCIIFKVFLHVGIVQYGKYIGALAVADAVSVDYGLGAGVYGDVQVLVSFPPAVDEAFVPELRFFQVRDVDKGHSLGVDAEQEYVSGESEVLSVSEVHGHDLFHYRFPECPFQGFFLPGEDLGEGPAVVLEQAFVQGVVVGRPEHPVVQGDGVHFKACRDEVGLEVFHQGCRDVFQGHVFPFREFHEVSECSGIVRCGFAFSDPAEVSDTSFEHFYEGYGLSFCSDSGVIVFHHGSYCLKLHFSSVSCPLPVQDLRFRRFLLASHPFPVRFLAVPRSLPGRPLRTFLPFLLASHPFLVRFLAVYYGLSGRFCSLRIHSPFASRPSITYFPAVSARFASIPRSLPGRPLRTFRRPFILPCPLYSAPSPSSRRFHSRPAFSQTPIPRSGHLSSAPTPLYSAQSQPSQPLRSRPAFSQTPIPRSGHLSFAPTPHYSAQSQPSQPLRSRPAFFRTPISRSGHLHSPLHLFTPLNRRLPGHFHSLSMWNIHIFILISGFLDKFANLSKTVHRYGMNKKDYGTDIIKYLLSAAVACFLLYFTFRGVKWDDFIAGLKSCRLSYIVVSMVAGIAAFWFRGLRWREILLPIDGSISRVTTFNAVNIGYIANFVFPRIGEFVRCGFITKNSLPVPGNDNITGEGPVKKRASYDKVLGTVVLERAWDMVTMFAFLVLLLAFRWKEFGGFFMEKMWRPFQENLSFSLWWLLLALAILCAGAVYAIWRTRARSAFSRAVANVCRGLLQGVLSCLRMKRKWKFFFYTGVIWLMYWLMSAATMSAMPGLDGLGPVDALFLMLAGSFGWLVPVPGGFGAFHFIVSLALSTIYGIPFETGLIFATLSHESQAITMAVCGGISYIDETFRKN